MHFVRYKPVSFLYESARFSFETLLYLKMMASQKCNCNGSSPAIEQRPFPFYSNEHCYSSHRNYIRNKKKFCEFRTVIVVRVYFSSIASFSVLANISNVLLAYIECGWARVCQDYVTNTVYWLEQDRAHAKNKWLDWEHNRGINRDNERVRCKLRFALVFWS